MSEKLWPVRPNPRDDESFTSWITRLALGSGLPPRTFYVQALGWQDVWTKDFDLFDDPDKLAFLVAKTAKPLEKLQQMVLDPKTLPVNFSGYLESHEFTHFCPCCLDEGKPYFRKIWRSSQVVSCPRHGIFLQARCGACLAPIRLLARTDTVDLGHCSACERPLSEVSRKVAAPDDLLAYTRNIISTFRGDWFPLGARQHVHPELFLRGLPVLAEIVCTREVWCKVYDHLGFSSYFAKPDSLCFQHRESFVDRCVFLLVLSWILADWPHRFTWATSDLPLRAFQWMVKNRDLPFWLLSVIQEVFDVPGADTFSVVEFFNVTRLISDGTLGKAEYHRAFGRQHFFRINGRAIKSFKNIYEESRRLHAG